MFYVMLQELPINDYLVDNNTNLTLHPVLLSIFNHKGWNE